MRRELERIWPYRAGETGVIGYSGNGNCCRLSDLCGAGVLSSLLPGVMTSTGFCSSWGNMRSKVSARVAALPSPMVTTRSLPPGGGALPSPGDRPGSAWVRSRLKMLSAHEPCPGKASSSTCLGFAQPRRSLLRPPERRQAPSCRTHKGLRDAEAGFAETGMRLAIKSPIIARFVLPGSSPAVESSSPWFDILYQTKQIACV
jgi:hypothetical protein